ncbi:DUF3368 domain-containing protein [Argonema galeatum]|uniref:DUF3368 domain-containing protein n=1 Tax=Argonema galeatum TaxID=2942762 RepID=UPI002011BA34|nr:DUF3368 domain-containing protein [Argonema galeatum A003/A1]
MPNVISDTSPIQYLYQLNLLDLLPTLYGQIIIPQAVESEIATGKLLGISLPNIASLPWITIRQPLSGAILSIVTELGMGEREALALTVEIPDSLVILDDALGRRYARLIGVQFTGTLGLLLKGKQVGYMTTIAPILDQLDALRFRLDPSTRAAVLKLAGELPV